MSTDTRLPLPLQCVPSLTRVWCVFDFFVRAQRSERVSTLSDYVFFDNLVKSLGLVRGLPKVFLHIKSGNIFDFFVRAI